MRDILRTPVKARAIAGILVIQNEEVPDLRLDRFDKAMSQIHSRFGLRIMYRETDGILGCKYCEPKCRRVQDGGTCNSDPDKMDENNCDGSCDEGDCYCHDLPLHASIVITGLEQLETVSRRWSRALSKVSGEYGLNSRFYEGVLTEKEEYTHLVPKGNVPSKEGSVKILGVEPGEACNRDGCEGIIEKYHRNYSHADLGQGCSKCDWDSEKEGNEVSKTSEPVQKVTRKYYANTPTGTIGFYIESGKVLTAKAMVHLEGGTNADYTVSFKLRLHITEGGCILCPFCGAALISGCGNSTDANALITQPSYEWERTRLSEGRDCSCGINSVYDFVRECIVLSLVKK